jgi:aspartate/methionine/tyrosine aminotransferase
LCGSRAGCRPLWQCDLQRADFREIDWPHREYQQEDLPYGRQFAEYLAEKVGVAVVPGDSFYWQPQQRITTIRLNFAQSQELLGEAMNRLTRIST